VRGQQNERRWRRRVLIVIASPNKHAAIRHALRGYPTFPVMPRNQAVLLFFRMKTAKDNSEIKAVILPQGWGPAATAHTLFPNR